MKDRSSRAFTIIEMIAVLVLVIALAGVVLAISRIAHWIASKDQAQAEILALSNACDSYRNDHGVYPQNGATDQLDPRLAFDPASAGYQAASRHLYSCLSGDFEPAGLPDFKPEDGRSVYFPFQRRQLSVETDQHGGIVGVHYVQDPFGYSYGYSTLGGLAEAEYQAKLKIDPTAVRPNPSKGYSPKFDLWSTGDAMQQKDTGKWIKSWSK